MTSCQAGSFSRCLNPHRFFQSEVLRLSFPALELWVALSVSPQLFLLFYPHTNVGLPGPPAATLSGPPATALPRVLSAAAAHLRPSYWSVWMNVSLAPWLSDFIQFDFLAVQVDFCF